MGDRASEIEKWWTQLDISQDQVQVVTKVRGTATFWAWFAKVDGKTYSGGYHNSEGGARIEGEQHLETMRQGALAFAKKWGK